MLTAEKKKYTVDDYLLLEEGAPFQLINYDLILSISPVPFHQLMSARIIHLLSNFLENKNDGGWVVSAPMDVMFDDGNVFQPDIIYIAAERKAALIKKCIHGAPDLIVEILSLSSAYYDLRQKKDIYEKFGVKEYIIIDPIAQNADLYCLKDGLYTLHQKAKKNELLNSLILDGLSFDLSKLFR
jgi:Uma2 family endonuclease